MVSLPHLPMQELFSAWKTNIFKMGTVLKAKLCIAPPPTHTFLFQLSEVEWMKFIVENPKFSMEKAQCKMPL